MAEKNNSMDEKDKKQPLEKNEQPSNDSDEEPPTENNEKPPTENNEKPPTKNNEKKEPCDDEIREEKFLCPRCGKIRIRRYPVEHWDPEERRGAGYVSPTRATKRKSDEWFPPPPINVESLPGPSGIQTRQGSSSMASSDQSRQESRQVTLDDLANVLLDFAERVQREKRQAKEAKKAEKKAAKKAAKEEAKSKDKKSKKDDKNKKGKK